MKMPRKALSFKHLEDADTDADASNLAEIQDDRFAAIEESFNSIVGQLESDPAMHKFTSIFSQMFDCLYLVYECKNTLSTKNASLSEGIEMTSKVLGDYYAQQSENLSTISTMKRDIENSHIRVDDLHAREQLEQEVIDNLQHTILNLRAEVEFKNKMSAIDAEKGARVVKRREGLEREKIKLMQEVLKLNEKIDNALEYQDELESRTDATDGKIHEICERLELANQEVVKQKRNKEKLDVQLKQQKNTLFAKNGDAERLTATILQKTKAILQQDTELKDEITAINKCAKEIEMLNAKFFRLQSEYDMLLYERDVLAHELKVTQFSIKHKRDENLQVEQQVEALTKTSYLFTHQLQRLQVFGYKLARERMTIRDEVNHLETEINLQKIEMDVVQRAIVTNAKHREILRKNLYRQRGANRDSVRTIKLQEERSKKLAAEIEMHIIGERKDVKHISYLERDRDRLVEEAMEKNQRIEDAMDDLRYQKIQLFDLKKVVAQSKNELRMQQNLYDAVRADKDALKKSLSETVAQTQELKAKFAENNRSNEHLKDEIAEKGADVLRSEAKIRQMMGETERIRADLRDTVQHIHQMRAEIVEIKATERHLHHQFEERDRTIRQHMKTIVEFMNERDVLGLQLVRRNEELTLLYDKVTLLQTTMFWGWKQYNQRMDDLRLLKTEIKRLRQEKLQLSKTIENTNDLQLEVFHLDRDLNQERLKCKLLQDEMINPLNIHRWRRLEGSDPEIFLVLHKVTLLQKRVVTQSNELMFRRHQLREVQTMYKTFKQIVINQPGPIIQQRLKFVNGMQNSLRQTKHLTREIQMANTEANRTLTFIRLTTNELNATRSKLLDEKKKRAKTGEQVKRLKDEVTRKARVAKLYRRSRRKSANRAKM